MPLDLAAARQSLLDRVTLTVDRLDAGIDPARLLRIKVDSDWVYPSFQFDSERAPFPEMEAIVAALPDSDGWDRLQWFLEPHEKLDGLTPLTVWSSDRGKVVEAARSERWLGRD